MDISDMMNGTVIWTQRKRNWCRTPFTFTVYAFTEREIGSYVGVFSKDLNVTKLYKVKDITVKRSFLQRLFGLSTLVISAGDKSSDDSIILKNIVHGYDVRNRLQDAVDSAKKEWHVTAREYLNGDADDDDAQEDVR